MISVIFPTRNRANLLAQALESLRSQTLSQMEFEIWVVDNGSTDNTSQVIRDYQNIFPNLHSIYEPEPGLHTGRHAGMMAAMGDILVFADDDIEALPTWLSSIKQSFEDYNVAMVGGNNIPMFLVPPPEWLKKMWQRSYTIGLRMVPELSIIEFTRRQIFISPYLVFGCNYAIRKDVLLSAGGFHPDGMPKELIRFRGDGETHVSRYVAESGLKCLFNQGASVFHKVTPERMTFDYFRQRGFNQGISDSYTALRNQDISLAKTAKWNLLRFAASWGLRNIKSLIRSHDEKYALAQMKLGYRNGYDYHQKIYREDPEVRNWVHKLQYF